ncbi:hypothetical protein MTO96_020468 [Rhipicephalus appendiculatus]
MSSEKDVKTALTEILEGNGVLPSLRASLRSEINCLINELILEYLAFNNYKRTASILEAESGYQRSIIGRAFLEKELHVALSENASQLPLLYSIVETLRNGDRAGTSSVAKGTS